MGENLLASIQLSMDWNCQQIRQLCPYSVRKAPSASNIRLDTPHPPGYAFYMVGMATPPLGQFNGYDVLDMCQR